MNRRGWGIALFLLILAAYALAGWRALLAHTDPTEMDTVAYLEAALQIRQTGGISQHLPNLIRGVYTEATQHPLYLLLLSPIARQDLQSFVSAKLVSYGVGFVFLAVFFIVIRRLFGTWTAGASGWLWLMSAGFLTLVTTVACEGLLGVFVIAFWWALSEGKENGRLWPAAAFAALAYLTKSIGILLLPVFVLSVFWWRRRDLAGLLRSPLFWGFFGVFALIASPLFVRNWVVYGSPLYSDSSGVLWIDRWSDFSYERAAEGRFTLANYLNTHSAGDILRTLWRGLTERTALMIGDGLKPLPFWRELEASSLNGFYKVTVSWQGGWAAALMGLAGIGWWTNRRHPAAVPTLALWGIFWVFVGWYSKVFPATPPTRLLYPVLILIPPYAVLGVRSLAAAAARTGGNRLAGLVNEPWPRRAVLSLLIAYCAGLLAHSGGWIRSAARDSAEVPAIVKLQLAWSQSVSGPQDRILVGDQVSSHLFYMDDKVGRDYVAFPKLDDMDALIAWTRREKIRWMFVDVATVLYNPQIFGAYYRAERPGILRPLKPLPPFFERVPMDPRIPPALALYVLRPDHS